LKSPFRGVTLQRVFSSGSPGKCQSTEKKRQDIKAEMEVSTKEKLTSDLKQAMKDGDTTRRSVIRMIMAAIQNAEIAKRSALDESDILGVIAREARQRQESIDAFKLGNRQDLIDKEEREMAILQEYLPRQATHEEIVTAARQVIADIGAEGPRDKGKVMPVLIARFKGKADGREINNVVTELLSS